MSFLLPETGLFIWMFIAFGIVYLILSKYAFPAIVSLVEKRKSFIDESLKSAREANEKLADIRTQSEKILQSAREEQTKIIREALTSKQQILDEARQKATIEGDKLLQQIRQQIQEEKQDALNDIRRQVAELSVDIAEKVMRKELSSQNAQESMIDRLIDESLNVKI